MIWQKYIEESIEDLKNQGLKRFLRQTQTAQGPKIYFEGREILNFCSNNYLGLANDSRLGQAVLETLKEEGYGSGASRLICGNMPAHQRFEERMAAFKKTERCLFFSSGYMANVGIISSFFGRNDIVFSDRLNHASIIDGIKLSGAQMKRYHHCDMDHLRSLLEEAPQDAKKGIITDSVFSMDGDLAPLAEIVKLAEEFDCLTMIDEAHALGIIGEKGKGLARELNVDDKIDIQMGTLSKAAGGYGAYVCASEPMIDFLINKARSFIYTTGLPPIIASAAIKAIDIIEREDSLREKLRENANYMRAGLRLAGFDTLNSATPIIPVLIKEEQKAVLFSNALYKEGVFISAIRPPTVPQGTSRLRVTVMASHVKADLDFALNKFQSIGKELCLI